MRSAWTLVGTIGAPGFGAVDPAGRVTVAGTPWSVDWWIGADDGWHVPSIARGVRQGLVGPGVVETRVRVPSGDAVQRVYGAGGCVVMEFTNDSPLPFGVGLGLDGDPPLVASREPFSLDAPPAPAARAVQFPVAHRATARVAIGTRSPDPLPTADEVGRGWTAHLSQGMQVEVPDPALQQLIDAARASLLLFDDGVEAQPAPFTGATASDRALVVAALDRWGFEASEMRAGLARRHRRLPRPLAASAALAQVDAMTRTASPTGAWARDGEGQHGAATAEFLLAVRDLLVAEVGPGEVEVVRALPPSWRGAPLEAHRVPVTGGVLSFALRWHGERAAVMWESDGVRITAPGLDAGWRATDARGEALLAVR